MRKLQGQALCVHVHRLGDNHSPPKASVRFGPMLQVLPGTSSYPPRFQIACDTPFTDNGVLLSKPLGDSGLFGTAQLQAASHNDNSKIGDADPLVGRIKSQTGFNSA